MATVRMLLLLILIPIVGMAQPHERQNMSLVGRWARGYCRSVEASEDRLVYSNGSTIFICDASDPLNPTELSTIVVPYALWDLAIEGDYIYAIDNGVHIIDASEPTDPREVGWHERASEGQIRVVDGMAIASYRTSGDGRIIGGFNLYDVSDPTTPQELSQYEFGGEIVDIELDQQYAYVLDQSYGVRIFSIANPAEPEEVATIYLRGEGEDNYTHFTSIAVRDTLLFAGPELRIFNCSNVEEISQLNENVVIDINDIFLDDNTLIGSSQHSVGITICDISDLTTPRILFQTDFNHPDDTFIGVWDLTVIGEIVYVASGDDGLYSFDVSSPAQPQLALNYQDGGAIERTLIWEDNIYCYAPGRLFSIDVSAPGNPQTTQVTYQFDPDADRPDHQWRYTRSLLHFDSFFYIFGEYEFKVVEYTELDGFSEVGEVINLGDRSVDAVIVDSKLYALQQNGLMIFDLASPSEPQLLGTYDFRMRTIFKRLSVYNRYAYASASSTVVILDVSNPEAIDYISQFRVNGNITDSMVEDSLLYATCGWYTQSADFGSLRILNIADPENVFEVGAYTPDDMFIWKLAKHANMVYLAAEGNGIHAIDVSNPASPREVGYYKFWSDDVLTNDSLVFGIGEEVVILRDDYEPSVVYSKKSNLLPAICSLLAYPNPANPATTIGFTVSQPGPVKMQAFDIAGRKVATLADRHYWQGYYSLSWVPFNLPSGNYLIRLSQTASPSEIQITVYR